MDWLFITFTFWHTSAALFGCIINIFLIYLCLYHSPKFIRVYATFIINFAVTDVMECLLDIFLEFRSIPIPKEAKLEYQYNGLCQFFGLQACQYGTSVFLHCIPYGYWSLLLSFSYRYYILNHPGLKRRHIICALLIIYIPSFLQMITFPHNMWDLQSASQLIHEKFPTYNITNTTVSVLDFTGSPSAFFAISYVCLPIYPVYIGIFILRRKIVKGLLINRRLLSKETKAVHAQMLKCLTYQTLIPCFMIVAAALYVLAQIGIVNNRGIEMALTSTYLPMPVLSSLTYLFFVRPYRELTQRIFCKMASKKTKPRSTSQVSTIQC